MLFPSRRGCDPSARLKEAPPPSSVLSCSDSDSELGPAASKDAPVLEAAAPSVVPLGGEDTPKSPPRAEGGPSGPKPLIPSSDSFINSLVSDRGDRTSTGPQPAVAEEGEELAPVLPAPEASGQDVPWMNVDLEGAQAAAGSSASTAACFNLGSLETSQGVGEEDGPVWAWLSGGGCDVDATSQISWLSPTGRRRTHTHTPAWLNALDLAALHQGRLDSLMFISLARVVPFIRIVTVETLVLAALCSTTHARSSLPSNCGHLVASTSVPLIH